MQLAREGRIILDLDETAETNLVTAEKVNNDEGVNAKINLKTLMFDRLQPSRPHQRPAGPSVFSRLGKGKTRKPSLFHKLKKDE